MNFRKMLLFLVAFVFVVTLSGCASYYTEHIVQDYGEVKENNLPFKFYVDEYYFGEKKVKIESEIRSFLVQNYPSWFSLSKSDAIPVRLFFKTDFINGRKNDFFLSCVTFMSAIGSMASLGIIPGCAWWTDEYAFAVQVEEQKIVHELDVQGKRGFSSGIIGGIFKHHELLLDVKTADWHGNGGSSTIFAHGWDKKMLGQFVLALQKLDKETLLRLYREKYEENIELLEGEQ